jgi:hypothetical protein
MLTGLAILERELGINDYTRHQLARRLAGKLPKAEADALRAQILELEERRRTTLRLLDELHEQYEERAKGHPEG